MDEPNEIKTLRTYQSPSLTDAGQVVTMYRVEFKVGIHGPFVVEFLPADFIPSKVRARQEEIAATVRAL